MDRGEVRTTRGAPLPTSVPAWELRRLTVAWHPDPTDIFCGPGARAAHIRDKALLVTPHFYVIANHRPIADGHLLLIPRWHVPVLGGLPRQWAAELDALQQRIRDFYRDEFGSEALFYENDIAWQSVHHAHLHAVPLPAAVTSMPPMAGAVPARSWLDVKRFFSAAHRYHLLQVGSDRRVFAGGTPAAMTATRWTAATLGVPVTADGRWLRGLDAAAADAMGSRFQQWLTRNPGMAQELAA